MTEKGMTEKGMRFEPTSNSAADHRLKAEVMKLFEAPANTTVEDILRRWLRQAEVEAVIVPTFSDENGEQEGVGFGFRRGRGEHFVVSVPLEDIRAQYPQVRPLSEFMSREGEVSSAESAFEIDFDRVDELIGINREETYDDCLCGDVFTFRAALAYGIMCGLTPGSTVMIAEREAETFEDFESPEWKYTGKRILSFDITFRPTGASTRRSVPGFSESFYAVVE